MSFKQVKIEDLQLNPWQTIGQDWLLVTAGDEQRANTMTASWGGLGQRVCGLAAPFFSVLF